MMALLRDIALVSQGLGVNKFSQAVTSQQDSDGSGLDATLQTIAHLGYVQIDTLSVVERAHHHVLWSRLADYEQAHLNRLTADKQIFEYWFHAISYLPMADYRYSLVQKESIRRGENRYFNFSDKALMSEILATIEGEGELRLRRVQKGENKSKGQFWNTGAEKRALEQLFMQGDVMVSERDGMEKVYNLTERCLPDDVDTREPTMAEYALYLFETTQRTHGVFDWKQLLHLKTGKALRETMREIVEAKVASGEIVHLTEGIKGIGSAKKTFKDGLYVDTNLLNRTFEIEPSVKILSPFDNLVIHRNRLETLFDFKYRMECYVPAKKRVYGYFCLPILYGNGIVGRMDCKAHRSEKQLEVLSFHQETGCEFYESVFQRLLTEELARFAVFNGCVEVVGFG